MVEARAVFLVMVVSVGSELHVGPGPSPLLRTYPESGSRELGGIRYVCDQEVGRTTKVKNNTRSMRLFPEKTVTMTHAEIWWVKQNCVRWV